MNSKELKQFFRDVRSEQAEIQQIKDIIQQKELSLFPKAIVYDSDKVQVSPEDRFGKECAAVADLEMELGASIMRLAKKQIKAEQMIRQIEDSNERKVMRYYYLTTFDGQLPTWNQVAIKMNYYERYVKKIHGSALIHLSETLSKGSFEETNGKEDTF